ncbi:hypothetical protein ACFWBN_16285 [Streptomyces sp. NPDC059989]|uniref:hypothetical protein n=1 Tax=Streptomyces sp. NPDC059989 TaxID=3347026 RepID=UPI0036A37E15
MTDKTPAELQEEINGLRELVNGKLDSSAEANLVKRSQLEATVFSSDAETVATQKWVKDNPPESSWWEKHKEEVIGAAFALTILKFEVMPFINIDPAIERWFNTKGWERNRFGVMWKVSQEEIAKRKEEALSHQKMIIKAFDKIRNSNIRIQALERKVGALTTRSNVSRQQVRHMESSPALQGTSSQVQLLERRVALLTAALS